MTDDARFDPPPVLLELLSEVEWDTEKGKVRHADYLIDDPHFPAGSIVSFDENSSGWSMHFLGPDGETLGILWSEPPDNPSDLIIRDT